jgi:GNAT superfamily N-acetyltransferase
MVVEFIRADPESPEARELVEELSVLLNQITGDDGKSSFNHKDMADPRAAFVIMKVDREYVACGSLRPITDEVCELKRMYSKRQGLGYGRAMLLELEKTAKDLEYREIWLSTRKVNKKAVDFYLKNNYLEQESYGKYKKTDLSICLSKKIFWEE